jgi:hypothetical protein
MTYGLVALAAGAGGASLLLAVMRTRSMAHKNLDWFVITEVGFLALVAGLALAGILSSAARPWATAGIAGAFILNGWLARRSVFTHGDPKSRPAAR